jgi:hypothetical protein
MSHYAQTCIQLLTVGLLVLFGMAAVANEQIAWRYDQNSKTERLLQRVACTDNQIAVCKQTTKECYQDCSKIRDVYRRADCLKLCSYESIRCHQACNR